MAISQPAYRYIRTPYLTCPQRSDDDLLQKRTAPRRTSLFRQWPFSSSSSGTCTSPIARLTSRPRCLPLGPSVAPNQSML